MNRLIPILAAALALTACGQDPAPVEEQSANEAPQPAEAAPVVEAAGEAAEEVAEEAAQSAVLPRTAAPEGARIFFVSPQDGDTVGTTVQVVMGAEGVDVVEAATFEPGTGHHHILINAELPDLGLPIPADENYVHFGKAQTETTLDLPPGTHTLQLLMGDGLHIPHDPPLMSEKITITVADSGGGE